MIKKRAQAEPANGSAGTEKAKPASRRSLMIYSILLIIFVVACIMLSFAIQNRNDKELDTLSQQNITAMQKIENLQNSNVELTEKYTALEGEKNELAAEVETLKSQLNEAETAAKTGLKNAEDKYKAEIDRLTQENTELKAKLGEKVPQN